MKTPVRRQQAGFSLLELMIASTIGLFVVGGILTLLLSVYQANQAQGKLAQINDNASMAMQILTNVLQSAGYIPDPSTGGLASNEMPATTTYLSAGQSLFGTYGGGGTASDTLSVRYVTGLVPQVIGLPIQDTQLNCIGRGIPILATNPSNYYIFDQTLSLDTSQRLSCSYTGISYTPSSSTTLIQEPTTAFPLIGDASTVSLSQITFLYGVDTNGDGSVDGYYNAAQVDAAGNWGNVLSVQATLIFKNPLANQAGQPATLSFSKTIALMSRS